MKPMKKKIGGNLGGGGGTAPQPPLIGATA